MMDDTDSPEPAQRASAVARLVAGLLQGLFLYGLYRTGDARAWPSTEPLLFAALALVGLFVPLIVIQGWSTMRPRALMLWSAAATIALVVLALHDRTREWLPEAGRGSKGIDPAALPSICVVFFSAIGLFLAHTLIGAADAERRWIARYAAVFEAGSKNAIQIALGAVFVGVFWGVLALGAALFGLIGLKFLSDLIEHAWFAIPVTTLAAAAALHLTDVRDRMVAGIRSVLLALLSRLLPLMAILALGFLIGLLFTGLGPLWSTRSAAALLLSAAAALAILINAAVQDGTHPLPAALRWSALVASLALVPLVALAGYAILLRVSQYGWTEDRVTALACFLIAAVLAAGYAADAVLHIARKRAGLLQRTNIVAVFAVLAALLALFTPLADPARLAVASQVARLHAGAVPPTRFDFEWLRFQGGRYGHEALLALKADRNGDIRSRAETVLNASSPSPLIRLPLDELASQVSVYPKDHLLPRALLQQDWWRDKPAGVPACLMLRSEKCEAFFAELNGDTEDEIIFVSGGDDNWSGLVLSRDTGGRWYVAGTIAGERCRGAREALRAGQYRVVAPTPPTWRAVDAGDTRLEIAPAVPPDPPCH